MTTNIRHLASAIVVLGLAVQAHASPLSFSGDFTQDDDIQLLTFTTTSFGAITIETFGYAGGTDANGNVVPPGGFDPVFALFALPGPGALLAIGDDGASRTDPVTGAALDALLTISLPAGSYAIALSQFDNFAIGPNFSDGFLETGNPTFTSVFNCGAPQFCDVNSSARNGHWDISISGDGVVGASVPEPGTIALLGIALAGVLVGLARPRTNASPGGLTNA